MTGSDPWKDAERQLLDAMLDQIIPASANGKIPAAGSLGVADFLKAKVDADPDLAQLFRHGIARTADMVTDRDNGISPAVIALLEKREPAFFEALLRQTYMGYYSRADIRPLFGLSPKPTQPDGYDVPADDPHQLAALTEPVKRRGRCYRVV